MLKQKSSKIIVSQNEVISNLIVEAINKLTNKMDDLSVQLRNMIMVGNISKLAKMSAVHINHYKTKLSGLEKDVPVLIKDSVVLKE